MLQHFDTFFRTIQRITENLKTAKRVKSMFRSIGHWNAEPKADSNKTTNAVSVIVSNDTIGHAFFRPKCL